MAGPKYTDLQAQSVPQGQSVLEAEEEKRKANANNAGRTVSEIIQNRNVIHGPGFNTPSIDV